MSFLFYKYNQRAKIEDETHLDLTNNLEFDNKESIIFDTDVKRNHLKLESFNNNLVQSYSYFNDLPFYIITFERIQSNEASKVLDNYSHTNAGESNCYLTLPRNIEAIYSIDLEDLDDYQLIYKKNEKVHDEQIGNFPKSISIKREDTLEFACSYINFGQNNKNKAFVFIKNFSRKIKSLIFKFEPKLFEISLNKKDQIIEKSVDTSIIDDIADKEPTALIVHGFMSHTENNFTGLKKALISSGQYKKIFGYTYSSNKYSILKSSGELHNILTRVCLLDPDKTLDIYAHSQGGLVSRSMISHYLKHANHSINNLILAGTPNNGTPFAKLGAIIFREDKKVDLFFTLIRDLLRTRDFSFYNFQYIVELLAMCNRHSLSLEDMQPGSGFIQKINGTDLNINGNLFISGYNFPNNVENESFLESFIRPIIKKFKIFDNDLHDGIVPIDSIKYNFKSNKKPIFIDSEGWHWWYYDKENRSNQIVDRVLNYPSSS